MAIEDRGDYLRILGMRFVTLTVNASMVLIGVNRVLRIFRAGVDSCSVRVSRELLGEGN